VREIRERARANERVGELVCVCVCVCGRGGGGGGHLCQGACDMWYVYRHMHINTFELFHC
jgi:hypothetical protein